MGSIGIQQFGGLGIGDARNPAKLIDICAEAPLKLPEQFNGLALREMLDSISSKERVTKIFARGPEKLVPESGGGIFFKPLLRFGGSP